jgi:Fe-S cluster assembly protein SufD
MMVSSGLEQETFKSFIDEQTRQLDATDLLYKIRLKASERLQELGLPTKKTEVYRYIKLRHFYSQNYQMGAEDSVTVDQIQPLILPECTHSVLVFVNGVFNASLSNTTAIPSKVVISSLHDAAQTYRTLLNNHLSQSLKEEKDAFAAINAAIHPLGAFIYIPPKTHVEAPIQILNFIDVKNNLALILPRLHVFVGAEAQAVFASTHHQTGEDGYLMNQVVDFVLEESAHVEHTQDLSNVPFDAWHLEAVRALLKRNAVFKSTCVTTGSATVRTDYSVILAGENCEVFLNGVWMLEGKNESHVNVYIEHQAPYCRSNQLFKGVLNDFSRSSFEGKIMVRQAAQKTEAFQLNNNLVLSDHAHADSKPNLEIFADDVKATHGATVGQLDAEQLFYMKTRGFPEAAAKNLLIFGFCEEVIERLPLESLKKDLSDKTRRYLK